ncbi:hypothetical protein D9Q98_005052 [Chlorella vulgaris]|uniref:Wax synthase domain-containing protein n=1 Tax=Chlorella vulgaris TaxID=3077 RepID=A0A9D4TNK5_CHLVU|nr:hypothetical protein D9Q98_005052 [Chlorella vulgaris]
MALAFMGKVLLIAVGLGIVSLEPPLLVLELLYTLGLYAILSFVMDGPAALFSAVIGMEVSPHFDAPWRSQSLADFWAKRWDLAAGNTLRDLVYEPVQQGRLVRVQSAAQPRSTRASAAAAHTQLRQRRALGSALSFLVSGAMHELQFGYMTGHWSGGLMMLFFVAQVPLLAVERRLGAALQQRGWRIPGALRAAATLGTLLLLSHISFWAACHRYGVTAAALASVRGVVAAGRQATSDVVHSGVSRLAAMTA